ncbi:MAG: hypothetical protein Q8Q75_15775, partial [Rhodoferax sp.]|uniref:hypothetical protein n=1 Tax=Rhodoferax sp. TaxID=50421 RepID=UPI002732F618
MVQSTLTTLVALLAIFAAPLACASDSASVVRGGRLYDNWSLEAKGRAPNHPNPAFKSKQTPIAPADSWRCVTCHGWDYQGAEGIKGISAREKTDPLVIAALLKDANHGYGELLSELDRLDLGNFVASGQTDMRKLQALALRSNPAQATSDKEYATDCANSHGLDGALLRQVPPLG